MCPACVASVYGSKKSRGAWDFLIKNRGLSGILGIQGLWGDNGVLYGIVLRDSHVALRGVVMGDSKRVVLNSRLGSCYKPECDQNEGTTRGNCKIARTMPEEIVICTCVCAHDYEYINTSVPMC